MKQSCQGKIGAVKRSEGGNNPFIALQKQTQETGGGEKK